MLLRVTLGLCCALMLFLGGLGASPGNPKVIIMTDIGGHEPDDRQSLIRLMLYSNEIDILGLIATGSCWQRDYLVIEEIHAVLDAYEQARPNLLVHAPGYPEAATLRAVTKPGHMNGIVTATADGYDTEGSDLIIAAVDANAGPVHICGWGGMATLARALFVVRRDRGEEAARAFADKLIVHDLAGQGDSGAWIAKNFPDIRYFRYALMWRGMSCRKDRKWIDSWGGNEAVIAPEWFEANVERGHGPLGALYQPANYLYEGDSPTFLNLIHNGLTDPEMPWHGGWGGRFGREKQANVRSGTGNTTFTEDQYDPYFMFTDGADTWTYGTRTYSNVYCTLFRWRDEFQNDFAARIDWANTAEYKAANHNPVAVVQGDSSKDVLTLNAAAGRSLPLDASGSSDPDDDPLEYHWWVYPEAGTYAGPLPSIRDASSPQAALDVPADASGTEIHVILSLRDYRKPRLSSYRRIVVNVAPLLPGE